MVIYIYTGCGWNIKYPAFTLQNKKYKEREREKSQGRICSGECCSVTLFSHGYSDGDRSTLRVLVLGLSGRYLSHPQGRIRSDSNCGYY